jgi:hypothetical protein
MGKGVLLSTRKCDGVQIVELQWTLASGTKALMYTREARMTKEGREEQKEKQMRHALLVIQQKEREKVEMEKKCLKMLEQLVPKKQLPFEKYNKDIHPPRVNMSYFPVDRKKRKVLSLTLRGKNFTDTVDVEMHEESILLHLYLKIYETFGIPMVHVHEEEAGVEEEEEGKVVGSASGSTGGSAGGRRTAAPGMLLRRSWAQFTAGLPDEALKTSGILKMDMIGCPSSEWKEEEALGSLAWPQSWFKKITECGICDDSRSGMVIVDDLRPIGQRREYGMILGQSGKGGMGFVGLPGDSV